MILARPDAAQHELLRDLDRQFGTMGLANQVEHQIDGGGAARRGDATAVHFEQLLRHLQTRVALLERLQRLPVQGQPVPVEQAGFGQDQAAGVDPAQYHPFVIELAQPVRQRRTVAVQRLEAGHHQQRRALAQRFQRRVDVDRHAIARQHRAAVQAQHPPAIQPGAKAVGHPQRFQCRNEAQRGESGQQQKVKILGHGGDSTAR